VVAAIVLVGALVTLAARELTKETTDAKPSAPLSIAVVGDSYSAGHNNRTVWPTLLAQRTGWAVANFALPGAGFAADGDGGQAFVYQVERAQGAHPQIILMVSGVADQGFAGTGDIGHGVAVAINKIKLGGQQALVIGPTWYELPIPSAITNMSDEISKAASDARVPFLNALDPPWLTVDQMWSDLSGPTDEGQSVIADKIAAWLRTEVAQ
jgi:hypothetical protein